MADVTQSTVDAGGLITNTQSFEMGGFAVMGLQVELPAGSHEPEVFQRILSEVFPDFSVVRALLVATFERSTPFTGYRYLL